MSRLILEEIIKNFEPDRFTKFFREKNSKFAPRKESYLEYNDENFINGTKLGEIPFESTEQVVVVTFEAKQPLSERSGKRAQYEKGKRILKEKEYDAGIFIFYDTQGNFRFSLIYANYLGRRRDWSTFRRFTYFVSADSESTNKTFKQRIGDADFSTFEKIKDAFSVEKVTQSFYNDIANWYFWAVQCSTFPKGAEDEENGRNIAIIRLITRLIFIWFMKERGLVPAMLFNKSEIINLLNNLDSKETTYYKAILQNLFFATLNTKNKDRKYRFQDSFQGKNTDYMDHGIYRYENYFKNKNTMLEIFKDIPFLNGGLFDCLDRASKDNNDQGEIRIDGFSDRDVGLKVPNLLFFSDVVEADLNKEYGTSNKKYHVRGLLDILQSYNFTIDENDPNDQEVALDPELLGKVFENLLASFNPETASTARKATGSYYTPREIVDYMVSESLKNYFKTSLEIEGIDDKLTVLFSVENDKNPFETHQTLKLVDLINDLRVVDPAVGSGAFPMGILNKLVFILGKLDRDNTLWKNAQIKAIEVGVTDPMIKKQLTDQIEERFTNKNFDYGRKLYLIQKCIYGVDIQQIAVEIAKLRFFISLLVDEKIDKTKENWGVEPLPNLDYKIMQGNSLLEEYEGIKLFDERLLNTTLPDEGELKEIEAKIKTLEKELLPYYAKEPNWMKNPKLERPQELVVLESEIYRLRLAQKDLIRFNQAKITNANQAQLQLQAEEGQSQEVWLQLQDLHKKLFTPTLTRDDKREIKKEIDRLEWRLIEATLREQNKTNELVKIEKMENSNTKPFFLWRLYFPEVFEEKRGFDIVIANPPYIRQEKIDDKLSLKSKYEVFNSVADLYTYFYERGVTLLKDNGMLVYITSSKFTRAQYGINLRRYLKNKLSIKSIVNFGDRHVFEAITNTLIMIAIKRKPEANLFNYSDTIGNPEKIRFSQSDLNDTEWTITEPNILQLKQKIEKAGISLGEWSVKINRGLLTGYNDAYIIDEQVRGKLLKKDNRAVDLIKPIIRGRDIERYFYNNSHLYIINFHNGFKRDDAMQVVAPDINNFPAIKSHFDLYHDKLEKRLDRGRTIYNLRDCAFLNDFSKEKIIWIELTNKNRFLYSDKEEYVLAGAFIMTGESLKYLLAFLNSKLCLFYFSLICNSSGMATIQWKKFALEKVPVKRLTNEEQKPFVEIVDKILFLTNSSDYLSNAEKQARVKDYGKQIDQLVYKLYGLTPEEIAVVEGSKNDEQ